VKSLSTTWPWLLPPNLSLSPERVAELADELNCSNVCVRTPAYGRPYGVPGNPENLPYGYGHRDIERAVKSSGKTVSLWPVVSFYNWSYEAAGIRDEVLYYNPTHIHLDAEIKTNVQNIGAFLRALDRLPCPVYLQSYRRADLHREMSWTKWYSYRAKSGEYIIDGHGHQLYPIGWSTPKQWIDDFEKSIESHEKQVQMVGREPMPWFPTLPTFRGTAYEGQPGWIPRNDAFLAAVEWLKHNLGSRLVGLNFWSLDRHLVDDSLQDLFRAVKELQFGTIIPPPQEKTIPPIAEGYPILIADARTRGVNV
jgi:hypothetical protein